MRRSKIEWTDHTFNPWIGCQKVGPGCENCYAEAMMANRLKKVQWGPGAERVRTSRANWRAPLAWNAGHEQFFAEHGRRQRVFCASLSDIFDNEVPRQWRQDLFDLILATPNLDWLLLTKRIGNAARMLQDVAEQRGTLMDARDRYRPLPNLWLGATVVNQAEADRDIPKLLQVPAAVRFLSIEPLLGAVDLTVHLWGRAAPCAECPKDADCGCGWYPRGAIDGEPGLDWVIAGGESGPGARPMHPAWARTLRDQCAAAGVPFLFKQWGEWLPWLQFNEARIEDDPEQTRYLTTIWQVERWDDCGHPTWWDIQDDHGGGANGPDEQDQIMGRVGKKAAGRLLDGVQHDGYPSALARKEGA